MKAIFEKFVQFNFPTACSHLLSTLEMIQERQNPPFSNGVVMIEILREYHELEKFIYEPVMT